MNRGVICRIAGVFISFQFLSVVLLFGVPLRASAAPDRITEAVDTRLTAPIAGHVHHLARTLADIGAADPQMKMDYMVLFVKPSAAQQADLDQLLADQQNPSSLHFREWLTPDAFGQRFGLSRGDESKLLAWLISSGFTINHQARGRNWIAFSGNAAQVEAALHSPIHRFQSGGSIHFANTSEPSIPKALAGVVAGFIGLNDFPLKSFAMPVQPDYNTGGSHYLVPQDFATIYDVAPAYANHIDGTGQSIVVVGQSDVSLSDLRAFRTRYGLPAKDPLMLPYSTDPGFTSSQLEGTLDLEWAGAIAYNASIIYVYGANAVTAMVDAVELNIAPIISVSYGTCEIDAAPSAYRSIAQQGNAQGITIVAASGDAGPAACDSQSAEPLATRGQAVLFPAVMPEVTGVGGTEFAEGTGSYWATANNATLGSALSYIPEAAWDESGSAGLGAGGGGSSVLYPRPAWQAGPGVPNDTARHVPDVAFTAASHDAYYINYGQVNTPVAGTSASAPSFASILALLNHYQVNNGFQKKAGLGNVNPQLYRLAQSGTAFHDVTSGNTMVPCAQGSPDCATGSFGYQAAAGYDMATGLGSVDVNALLTQWNAANNGVTVSLSSNVTTATLNDTIQLTATVAAASGTGTPTGTVSFEFNTQPLGVVSLTNGSASLAVPAYETDAVGTLTFGAEYSGDASFSSGGATKAVKVTLPTGVSSIVVVAPNTVWPSPPDAQGLSWQASISLLEVAGVAAQITSFAIDGQNQPLAQYFPSTEIPQSGSISTTLLLRNVSAPVTHTYAFTGTDASGQAWTRQVSVNYLTLPTDNFFSVTATPLTITQNPAADPSCQWATQLNVDDLGGFGVNLISGLQVGGANLSNSIAPMFGTPRLDAWGDLQGTLCFGGITPPASDSITVTLTDGASFNSVVSFAGPPSNPARLTASPQSLSLAAAQAQPGQATLTVNLSDPSQSWTATVFPANRTTAWLSASQLSGIGSSQIAVTASSAGFEPGVYRANIVIQSANSIPQYINVPVMFTVGGSSSGTSISRVGNAASDFAAASPGELLNVYGSNLSTATQSASGDPLPYSTAGVSATVNGFAAPVLYASPQELTIQVPYSAGAGPGVLGINNNGQIAGFPMQITPAAPGIYTDPSGNVLPAVGAQQGGFATIYVTGTGEVTPALKTAWSPLAGTSSALLPKPVLPFSVTVGGVEAFIQYAAVSPGLVGTLQVNLIVPKSVPTGVQPIVVTAGGVGSPPANILIVAAASSTTAP